VNLASYLHRDEKFWGDPLVFRPERFLDEAGNLVPADHPTRKHLMPFGAGVRECVGEVFALRRLFVLVTSLVQTFNLEPGDCKMSCDPANYVDGIILTQKSYTVRLLDRML
jgi:cytochrome P450